MGYYSHYTLMEITKIHILNKMAKKNLATKKRQRKDGVSEPQNIGGNDVVNVAKRYR